MSTQETFTARQLEAVRKTLWRQDGAALMTLDQARNWIEAVGLIPYMPRTQQLPAPMPSFVEAILGRPENGYVVPSKKAAAVSEDEADQIAAEDEESDEDEGVEDDELDEQDPEAEDDSDDLEDEEEDTDELEDADADEVLDADEDVSDVVEDEAAEAEPEEPVEIINGFTAEQMEVARVMLARLVASGAAVPLNLLGTINDTPDFICSAQAFSFVYTLRGDKGWKQAPLTTGAMSVSPLGAKTWETLKEKGSLTAGQLTFELGREVTEAAVLRALSELWSLARVVPVPQADGSPVMWELMTGRYVRHIKAGANAGQPTAMSALLSLYLSTVVAATSEEMEIFLSPLSARSRVREVVGGLSATRQLDATVLGGKTLLHIAGDLPEFPNVDEPAKVAEAPQFSRYERPSSPRPAGRDKDRGGKPGYPVRRPAGAPDRNDRERRPFKRRDDEGGGVPKREFTKPWDEERAARPAASGDGERKPFVRRDSEGGGERKPFVRRESPGGSRPSFGDRKPYVRRDAEGGERKPYPRRDDAGSGERKPYQRREGGESSRPSYGSGGSYSGGSRPAYGGGNSRPSYGGSNSKPAYGGSNSRPSSDGGERKPYPRREGGSRPPFGDRKPFVRRDADGGGERPSYPRRDDAGSGERKPYQRREGGESSRPAYGGGGSRPAFGDRKPFVRRDSADGGERKPFVRREGSGGARPSFGERKPYVRREGGDAGERKPYARRDSEGGSSRPSFGGDRKPYPRRDGAEGGERKPFVRRDSGDGGERKPYARPSGGSGFGGGPKKFGSSFGGGGAGRSGGGFAGKPGGRKPSGGGFAGRPGGRPGGSGPRRDGDAPRRRPDSE